MTLLNIPIDAATRTKTETIFPAKWFHRQRKRNQLEKIWAKIDLLPAEPPDFEFLAKANTVARKRIGSIGVRRYAIARRLKYEAKGFLDGLTIAR